MILKSILATAAFAASATLALADGNVDVRRRHCVRIDAVGQQHVPVFGQLAEKYPHVARRQMLEHVLAQQEIGRRKIQFDDVADKERDVRLGELPSGLGDGGLDDVEALVVDAAPVERLGELPIAAAGVHHRANGVVFQELLQERAIDKGRVKRRPQPGGSLALRVRSPYPVTIDVGENLLRCRRRSGGCIGCTAVLIVSHVRASLAGSRRWCRGSPPYGCGARRPALPGFLQALAGEDISRLLQFV